MARFKSHPIFSSLLTVCGIAVLAEVYLLIPLNLPFNQTHGRKQELRRLDDAHTNYSQLQKKPVTPTAENLEAIKNNRIEAEKALVDTREYIKGASGLATKLATEPVPPDSTSAWTTINLFRNVQLKKFREAVAASVAGDGTETSEEDRESAEARKPEKFRFKENDTFGFAAYINSGPSDPEVIRQVFKQTQLADYLLSALLAAKPLEFVSLQREFPATKAMREEQDKAIKEAKDRGELPPLLEPLSSASPEEAADYFPIDPLISARVPGAIDTTAFQVIFIGRTKVLRDFLNKVASRELPFKVQRVEVAADEPTPPPPLKTQYDEEGNPITPSPADMPKTVAPSLYSKFTVTVEYIDLVTPPAASADPSATK